MRALLLALSIGIFLVSCNSTEEKAPNTNTPKEAYIPTHKLNKKQAYRLSNMALHCMQQEYPYKLGQVLAGDEDLLSPQDLHPAFYGCYDWHSAVHGHWLLVRMLKEHPNLSNRDTIVSKLGENITAANILKELEYFNRKTEKSFERTYGWAWLLKLSQELETWDHPEGKKMASALKPLSDFIVDKYKDFIPRLVYPIRIGEHSNTGFGLAFAHDYARHNNLKGLQDIIDTKSKQFYQNDENCPISWEPGGFDFLSPCLEEVDIMRRVLPKEEFLPWLKSFLPQLSDPSFSLEVAKVSDRSDAKLVHLDGVNFSRAWVLYGIAAQYDEYKHLAKVADQHIGQSINLIDDGEYSGTHWLGSFAVYALTQAKEYEESLVQ